MRYLCFLCILFWFSGAFAIICNSNPRGMQNMKEGFLIGGGLIVAGLMLELSVGPVVWDAFAWPLNGIVLAG